MKYFYLFAIVILLFSCTKKIENIKNTPEEINQIESKEYISEEIIEENIMEEEIIFFDINKLYNISNGLYRLPLKENINSKINVYEQPDENNNIIGELSVNTIIEIIENTKINQIKNNINHYWYKIKYTNYENNQIVGYIWGGAIIVNTIIYENDEKIEIFCYNKISYMDKRFVGNVNGQDIYNEFSVILPNDIFIYINNIRINNRILEDFHNNNETRYVWEYCYFRLNKYYIDLDIHNMGAGDSFRIYPNGNIELLFSARM